jgi:hypothetical protein
MTEGQFKEIVSEMLCSRFGGEAETHCTWEESIYDFAPYQRYIQVVHFDEDNRQRFWSDWNYAPQELGDLGDWAIPALGILAFRLFVTPK